MSKWAHGSLEHAPLCSASGQVRFEHISRSPVVMATSAHREKEQSWGPDGRSLPFLSPQNTGCLWPERERFHLCVRGKDPRIHHGEVASLPSSLHLWDVGEQVLAGQG